MRSSSKDWFSVKEKMFSLNVKKFLEEILKIILCSPVFFLGKILNFVFF